MTGEIRQCAFRRLLRWVIVVLIMAAGADGVAPAQVAKNSPPTGRASASDIQDLSLAESIPFPVPPPLALVSEIKCDLKGNIYVAQTGSLLIGNGGLSTLPVSKLSITSKSTVAYPVPSLDGYRGVVRSHFDVGADGHLNSLLEALDSSPTANEAPPSFFIAKYHDDGSLDSYFKLEDAPERHIQPFRFAVFRDGNIVVTGTAVEPGKPLRPFVAVVDSSGRFFRYVKLTEGRKPVSPISEGRDAREKGAAPASPAEVQSSDPESDRAVGLSSSSRMVSAPDGNVYLLRGSGLYQFDVITSAGEVAREFEVPAPAPGLTATNLAMAGDDQVFIAFRRVQSGSVAGVDSDGPDNLISVVSPQREKVIAVYRLPSEANAFEIPACAASSDDFLFLGATADQQHQQVTRYRPRSTSASRIR